MKLVVLVIFLVFPWISRVGDWALGWTEGNEQLQIFFVMMFFPLIMNALQYYVIDSFIKKAEADHERLPEEDPDWATGGAGADPYDADLFSSDDEEGTIVKMNRKSDQRSEERQEYDPECDGDAPTIVGSSTSRHQPKLTRELYPKE